MAGGANGAFAPQGGQMTTRPYRLLLAMALTAAVLGNGRALGKVIDGGPQHLSQDSSIGESLRNAGPRPLHILYVHGIAAMSAGGSQMFQRAICGFLKDCTVPEKPAARDYADSGKFANGSTPPAFTYMGRPVWRDQDEWSASAPFVDHYVLNRTDGGPIVVDEINWWPLALPLKCRAIVASETRLAGPNAELLDFCSQPAQPDPARPGRFRAYTWISREGAKQMETAEAQGALINRWFKNSILDWGFSDAMLAVGSMHGLFREGMRQLFLKSVRFNANGSETGDWEQQWKNPQGTDREFIVVSHSLGSYMVFSTLNLEPHAALPAAVPLPPEPGAAAEDAASEYILERTSLVYFFANQVPLLELTNLEGPRTADLPAEVPQPEKPPEALSAEMTKWTNLRQTFAQRGGGEPSPAKRPQVIAWSDPSDLLSWRLPAMDGLVVTNLYVRNTAWHWFIANPAAAHANYAVNKDVLRIMFGPRHAGKRDERKP
jgi:hypothetical protein